MTDPVTFTLAAKWWWLLGTFALAGACVTAFEAYWCAMEVCHDLWRYISRRLTRHRRPDA